MRCCTAAARTTLLEFFPLVNDLDSRPMLPRPSGKDIDVASTDVKDP